MPYLSLFRSGALPSFARLPITPGPPAAGQYWRLQWEAADRAFVLPGERLCAFFAETGDDTLSAVAPVPGRLEISVPGGRFLAAETTVGELCYGTALEEEFRREAAASAAGADTAELATRRQQLAAETTALRGEIAALREQLVALRGKGAAGAAPAAGATAPDTAAALPTLLPVLLRLLRELPETEQRALTLHDRLHLLTLLQPVRAALIRTGQRRPLRRPAADTELHRALVALDRLYSDRLAWAAADPPGLPDTLQPQKLAIWQALRDRHIALLWREGLPPDRPAAPPDGAKEGKATEDR